MGVLVTMSTERTYSMATSGTEIGGTYHIEGYLRPMLGLYPKFYGLSTAPPFTIDILEVSFFLGKYLN